MFGSNLKIHVLTSHCTHFWSFSKETKGKILVVRLLFSLFYHICLVVPFCVGIVSFRSNECL